MGESEPNVGEEERCHSCGSSEHDTTHCPAIDGTGNSDGERRGRCSKCGSNDHDVNDCPKLHEESPNRE